MWPILTNLLRSIANPKKFGTKALLLLFVSWYCVMRDRGIFEFFLIIKSSFSL